MTAIHLIIGTLQRMNVFGIENRDTLTHKATGVIILSYHLIIGFQFVAVKHPNLCLFLRSVFSKAFEET